MKKTSPLRKKLTKIADFISAIKPSKFDMSFYTDLNGQKRMNPLKCTSAGCVIGWFPSIFPSKFRWNYRANNDWGKWRWTSRRELWWYAARTVETTPTLAWRTSPRKRSSEN